MTDTELLLQKIKDSGLKMFYIAERVGVSYPRLMDRINNKVEFKASEIATMKDLLRLTKEERDKIFFC